jgi:hypothetical protein
MLVAMSGLFWWSAEMMSIFQPLAAKPESSTGQYADLHGFVLRKGAAACGKRQRAAEQKSRYSVFHILSMNPA